MKSTSAPTIRVLHLVISFTWFDFVDSGFAGFSLLQLLRICTTASSVSYRVALKQLQLCDRCDPVIVRV